MKFEWDEVKNRLNIQKHGIDFKDAADIFNHPMLTLPFQTARSTTERSD
jgi:uncharacterized protein